MRGEDALGLASLGVTRGSPPHARGRLGIPADSRVGTRITPACAGKTLENSTKNVFVRDHPRMRGEDCLYVEDPYTGAGSPPHARGRRGQNPPREEGLGITPACAGKTAKWERPAS